MSTRRRRGWLTLAVGLALLVLLGRRGVGQPPLYDGVVVEDPYLYLEPAAGAPGNPTSVSDTVSLDAGVSPAVYSGTLENPPQAQLIVDRDAIALAAGTTSIKVGIEPIAPPAPAPTGQGATGGIAGNVYRFTIANQAGTELRLRAGKTATIVLRAPNGLTSGVITRFTGTEWASLATDNAGLPDLFAANSAELGAFAVTTSSAARSPAESGSPGAQVSPGASEAVGPAPSVPAGGPSAPIWIAIGLLAVALLLGIWYLRDVARGPSPSGRR